MSKKTSKSTQQKQETKKSSDGKTNVQGIGKTLKKELLEQIELKSKKQKNGCIKWMGTIVKKNIPRLSYDYKIYYVRNLVWNLNNPDNEIDTRKDKIVSTCDDDLCVNIEHLNVESRRKILTKEETWNKMKKNSYPSSFPVDLVLRTKTIPIY